ncbi:hypothetical protein AB1K70_07360 [Bremerella sp. JC770]|uniref:hypothetical protein n=1 Tax=Bremerella sp. JC770 TaxID=3232137 RepID=UPI003458999E
MYRILLVLSVCLSAGCYDYPDRFNNLGASSSVTGAGGKAKTAQDSKDHRDLPDYAVVKIQLRYRELDPKVLQNALPLPYLEELDLRGTNFGNDQLKYLSDCPQLKRVLLDFTKVSDEGLWILSDVPQLEFVSLSGCNVSDQIVDVLLACKNLKSVTLINTHVTQEGAKRLKEGKLMVTWLGTLDHEKTRLALARLQRKSIFAQVSVDLDSDDYEPSWISIDFHQDARIDPEVLLDLQYLEQLVPLRMTVRRIDVLPILAQLTRIDKLTIYAPLKLSPGPTDITPQNLKENPVASLTSLDMSVRDLPTETLVKWIRTKGLEDLRLNRQAIDPTVWQAIIQAPTLKRIEFNFCEFQGWDQFQPAPQAIEVVEHDRMLSDTPEEVLPLLLRLLGAGQHPDGEDSP